MSRGQIYSVWNQPLGAFEYFESTLPQQKLNVEKPTHLRSRTLGSTVDQAAWPLPGNLRRIGSGPEAIGKVAASKGGVSLGDYAAELPLVKAGLLVGAAWLAWKYVVKGRRS